MRNFSCIFTSCFLALSLSMCGSGTKKTTDASTENDMFGSATGYATIYDEDKALARDRATDDAMNRLVKKKLGTSIHGKSIVQDYQLIESIVEARSTGMVRNWKITNETQDGSSYVVTLEGEVYPQAVKDTISATLENYGRPKFMVLVDEQLENKRNLPGFTITETTMMNIMGNAGFEFVDAAITQELIRKEKASIRKAMEGKVGGNVQDLLLNDVGAEVIIIGTTRATDQSGTLKNFGSKNYKSKQAIINLKAVDVYTGRILASVSSNAPGAHINDDAASQRAIQACLERKTVLGKINDATGEFESGNFIHQITRKFLVSATRRMIMINIAGLNYKELTAFRNALLQRVRGVSKVYSRGSAGRYAKIEVQFAGKTTDLVDELNAKSEKFGFEIEIKETYPNKVIMTANAIK